jgi:2-methylcitrate dehydratase PrpD
MVPLVCEPADAKITPRTRYDGKFSLFFTVAAMLADGTVDTSTFTEAKIKNSKILELAKRVKYSADSSIDYPRLIPGKVLIKTKNGATYEFKVDTTPGGPEYPMTKEEHTLKFKSLASTFLNERATEAIIQTIDRLEELENVRNLMKFCK